MVRARGMSTGAPSVQARSPARQQLQQVRLALQALAHLVTPCPANSMSTCLDLRAFCSHVCPQSKLKLTCEGGHLLRNTSKVEGTALMADKELDVIPSTLLRHAGRWTYSSLPTIFVQL